MVIDQFRIDKIEFRKPVHCGAIEDVLERQPDVPLGPFIGAAPASILEAEQLDAGADEGGEGP